MNKSPTFYLTTPIFYANAAPHMGHAYTAVLADMIARHRRARGDGSYFLTGTDEHGIKNFRSAEAAGKKPQEFVDEQAQKFRDLFSLLEISNDQFIRTTDREVHWPGAQALWKKLAEEGDIYKGVYEGLYCTGCETFKTDTELVDGKCPDHDRVPEHIQQENYFFRLSKYTARIKEAIEKNELAILPETRRNEILSLLGEGLEDVSFSRPKKDLPWGIPVPGDDSQVMYVWCDALANYISALGYGRPNPALFDEFWPANLHIVGKDILRFHAALWPGMLMSAGLPLPRAILVHGLILSEGKKMSKTIGNIVDPVLVIQEFGVDAFRFYLAHEINPFEDGDFSMDKFRETYNAYLANGVGNVTSRVMKMAESYLSERTTSLEELRSARRGDFEKRFNAAMEEYRINDATHIVTELVSELDQEIAETQPFKLIKTDPEKAKEIVEGLVEGIAELARLSAPFIPATAAKIESAIRANKMPEPLFVRK